MATSVGRAARPTRIRLQIFGILWVLVLLNFIDRAALGIALPFISEEFALTPEIEGWLLGSFFWTYLLLQIPGGWLLDRFGPRKIIGFAGVIWGGFQLLGGLATSGILLTVTRLGLGASEAPVFPAAAKLNSKWLPSKELRPRRHFHRRSRTVRLRGRRSRRHLAHRSHRWMALGLHHHRCVDDHRLCPVLPLPPRLS